MVAILLDNLILLFSSPILPGLIVAAVISGILFGLLPGLGGTLAIALFIPLVAGADPLYGVVFLVAMHAVVHTAGSVPSILFGVPGTGADVATVVDGLPMTRKGEAGRALGASLSASGFGGVVGGIFLFAMIPVVEPVIMLITPSEYFLLAVLGISFISAVSGNSLRKGITVGCLGLCLAFVGLAPTTGEPRLDFGQVFFWGGLDTVTLVLAIFAVPELVALGANRRPVIVPPGGYTTRDIVAGMGELLNYKWLALRTSVLGAIFGMIPGLGGDVASWMCYGHAVQSSRTPERFGKGAVEGVIAPETANNSKEGGALIPTLFFGIPGSSGMAVLLTALVVLDIQPGPTFLVEQRPLLAMLIIVLVIANLLAVGLLLLSGRLLARCATLPAGVIVPVSLIMVVMGVYLSSLGWQNLIILLLFSLLGHGLKKFGWPRAPLVIGLVLGGPAEMSLNQAIAIWGYDFFLRPMSLVLIVLILSSLVVYYWKARLVTQLKGRFPGDV